jgi:hypothetical protein
MHHALMMIPMLALAQATPTPSTGPSQTPTPTPAQAESPRSAAPVREAEAERARATPRRVEGGRQDTGPLATSNLVQPVDLRQDGDFRNVYQLPDVGGNFDGWFARAAGGITAVFPRGQYSSAQGPDGSRVTKADIPANTTFFIGPPPIAPPPARPTRGNVASLSPEPIEPERIDGPAAIIPQALTNRVETLVPTGAGEPEPRRADADQPAASPEQRLMESTSRLFSDERYRDQRIGRLINASLGRTRPQPAP